jgi:hypothetical protein
MMMKMVWKRISEIGKEKGIMANSRRKEKTSSIRLPPLSPLPLYLYPSSTCGTCGRD